MANLPILKGKDLIKFLQYLGFERIRQKGSHVRMKHEDGRVLLRFQYIREKIFQGGY